MDPNGYAQAFLTLVQGRPTTRSSKSSGLSRRRLRGMDAAVAAELRRWLDQVEVRVFTLAGAS